MTVPVWKGDESGVWGDSAIGLVSCSSARGLFHSAPGEGRGAFWGTRLASTFSIWEPKACLGYAWNGHTALMARMEGHIVAVVGWNPWSYGYAQAATYYANWFGAKNRFTCSGTWYDDSAMIHDPTSISLEIGVLPIDADSFAEQISGLVGQSGIGGAKYEYTFMPAEMESNEHPFVGQCTELAVIVLCSWLYRLKTSEGTGLIRELLAMANSQDMNERNLLQGKMMQFITNWNKKHK